MIDVSSTNKYSSSNMKKRITKFIILSLSIAASLMLFWLSNLYFDLYPNSKDIQLGKVGLSSSHTNSGLGLVISKESCEYLYWSINAEASVDQETLVKYYAVKWIPQLLFDKNNAFTTLNLRGTRYGMFVEKSVYISELDDKNNSPLAYGVSTYVNFCKLIRSEVP